MLLVMWAVAPVGWVVTAGWCRGDLFAPADPSPGTPNDRLVRIMMWLRRPRTCSLPRHAIRERIEQPTVRITTACKASHRIATAAAAKPGNRRYAPRLSARHIATRRPIDAGRGAGGRRPSVSGVDRRHRVTRRRSATPRPAGPTGGWWDADADDYQAEHGAFLGDVDFVWCPEGLREADARLLGDVRRAPGAGARAAAPRPPPAGWPPRAPRPVAMDLSAGMLRHAAPAADRHRGTRAAGAGRRAGPAASPTRSFDIVCTAFGAIPFVADSAAVMREVSRVLRPGGRWVFSVTHPMRWIFLDDPGEGGLIAVHSYFDRSPLRRAGRRRGAPPTSSSTAPSATGSGSWSPPASACCDLVEPEWPEGHEGIWGQWSPLRGRLFPGTAIFVAEKPAG